MAGCMCAFLVQRTMCQGFLSQHNLLKSFAVLCVMLKIQKKEKSLGWINPVLNVLVYALVFMQADQGTATVNTLGAYEVSKTFNSTMGML